MNDDKFENDLSVWEKETGATVIDRSPIKRKGGRKVRCRNGHASFIEVSFRFPRGGSKGFCSTCAEYSHNVFYALHSTKLRQVKIGITSGDPRPRLRQHMMYGFNSVTCLLTDLPSTVAPDLEAYCINVLETLGFKPVSGREFFDEFAIEEIEELVEGYPYANLKNWENYPRCGPRCKAAQTWNGPCTNPCPSGYGF